jgi:hypothetical protein
MARRIVDVPRDGMLAGFAIAVDASGFARGGVR